MLKIFLNGMHNFLYYLHIIFNIYKGNMMTHKLLETNSFQVSES